MAKKIFDVKCKSRMSLTGLDGDKVSLRSAPEVLSQVVSDSMFFRNDEEGVVCYLTRKEFEKARGWSEGSCVVGYQEHHPENGQTYRLKVTVSHPGNNEIVASFRRRMPQAGDIAERIMDYLDANDYYGTILIVPPKEPAKGTYHQVKNLLSERYNRGEIVESRRK